MYRISSLILLCSLFISCQNESKNDLAENETPIVFNIREGFELEELYHPSAQGQGSWVALAQGPDNTLFACDQRGKIYTMKTPAIGSTIAPSQVDSLDLRIGEAHGLLWAHNSLYVAVNKKWDDDIPDSEENGSGVYRIQDSDNDGELDQVTMLLKLEGQGEHGPHSFALAPNGEDIYFIAGNHTIIPDPLLENSRLPTNWGEDNLIKPYLDARGHANDIKAPGGWVSKFNPEGTEWELISAGYRNPFDLAFNQDGELFTYDSDMEWDIGMPWYRPTRICHVTSGSEYGWRTGSGKWPAYYPDNLPAVQNMEQGSPTAVLSGAALSFPPKYRNGLLVMDWSFGTVYFVNLIPEGSSYRGQKEEFLSGTPLPLTDMINGADGHLYFATGGRGLDSHLYRLHYTGTDNEMTEATADTNSEALRELRHRLEQFHTRKDAEAIPLAMEHLNHPDRFIRYAARVALEQQPIDTWKDLFPQETDFQKIIEMAIAMAHQGNDGQQSTLLRKLNGIPLEQLSDYNKTALLRAYSLSFIRMGAPSEQDRMRTASRLKSYFPHASNAVTRELGQLLLYLKAEGITEGLVQQLEKHTEKKTVTEGVELLSEETTLRSEQYGPVIREVLAKMPPSESIYYGMLLSRATEGWTKPLREKYFLWFYDVLGAKGGMSFKAYMENVRQQAIVQVPENEREYFEEISGVYSPSTAVADLPEPIGPGKAYSGNDMSHILWGGGMENYEGTVEAGERAYQAGMCILCHRMRGEGGGAGPDLTQAHTKFGNYDLLFAIYSPNDEISDQYANTLFHLKDGKKLAGRIKSEEGDSIVLMPNSFNESYTVQLAKSDIEKRELSPISPMPAGLLNRLNEQEVLDLFAYLQSGGDANHEVYSGAKSR
ncbi:c-type cytochrome [Flavobacteriaceae bacterium TP-CH-4]|uniref:C-type cytochrome n=1 Tax=Pelagihabitans pacificus TaxID=2696054 RepID=A0A967E7P8_9FLAO|nr:c-type cytochrome [Pelagihabitans pacificus]NHF60855.1 c-type cytochrome [Pelagihabitans pacificus]